MSVFTAESKGVLVFAESPIGSGLIPASPAKYCAAISFGLLMAFRSNDIILVAPSCPLSSDSTLFIDEPSIPAGRLLSVVCVRIVLYSEELGFLPNNFNKRDGCVPPDLNNLPSTVFDAEVLFKRVYNGLLVSLNSEGSCRSWSTRSFLCTSCPSGVNVYWRGCAKKSEIEKSECLALVYVELLLDKGSLTGTSVPSGE